MIINKNSNTLCFDNFAQLHLLKCSGIHVLMMSNSSIMSLYMMVFKSMAFSSSSGQTNGRNKRIACFWGVDEIEREEEKG